MARHNGQLAFDSILDHSFQERLHAIDRYARANRDTYIGLGLAVSPELRDPAEVWDRFAFAILSANAGFAMTVRALEHVREHRGKCCASDIAQFGMVPAKARYLNDLPADPRWLLRDGSEPWHDYRLRLQRSVRGLALTKASFAACLLYPMSADLACIDTHMQKVYLGRATFKYIGMADYIAVETQVRKVRDRHALPSTFLAQWLIWDHTRGRVEDHAIFPGGHKETDPWQEW